MNETDYSSRRPDQGQLTRREILTNGAAALAAPLVLSAAVPQLSHATDLRKTGNTAMSPKAFVYTEVQISVPFEDAPWRAINEKIKKQPGFLNKTWLSGAKTNSLGGIYAFESIENAQSFVTGYFPEEAGSFGAAHNTRVFDATKVQEASVNLDSAHFGIAQKREPKAFVYTEVQINKPFEEMPWQDRNSALKQVPGLISKTWLSGLHTNTVGGFDAFDSLEHAQDFALNKFPETARKMNAAFYTRLFDADITATASKDMYSPFYRS